jgi:hypothetical protein
MSNILGIPVSTEAPKISKVPVDDSSNLIPQGVKCKGNKFSNEIVSKIVGGSEAVQAKFIIISKLFLFYIYPFSSQ